MVVPKKGILILLGLLFLMTNAFSAPPVLPTVQINFPNNANLVLSETTHTIDFNWSKTDYNVWDDLSYRMDVNIFLRRASNDVNTLILSDLNLFVICDNMDQNDEFIKNCTVPFDFSGVPSSGVQFFLDINFFDGNTPGHLLTQGAFSFRTPGSILAGNIDNIARIIDGSFEIGAGTVEGVAGQSGTIGLAIGLIIAIGLLVTLILLVLGIPKKLINLVKGIGK